jgi:prephenate dehydrogenase
MPEPSFEPSFKKKRIGIIGYGRFGQLTAKILSTAISTESTEVVVFSRRFAQLRELKEKTTPFLPIEEIGTADVIIPCIPISDFEKTIQLIAPLLNPTSVVIDVCSVKVFPIEVMKKYLSESVEIIGSHPIFGPDSFKIKNSVAGYPLVLVKVRCTDETYQKVKDFAEKLQLKILEMTAEEHDRQAAYSQAYAFLIGKISERMNIQPTSLDTVWYKLLLQEREAIMHDTQQLFLDIQNKNPFTEEMRQKFLTEVTTIFDEIEKNR